MEEHKEEIFFSSTSSFQGVTSFMIIMLKVGILRIRLVRMREREERKEERKWARYLTRAAGTGMGCSRCHFPMMAVPVSKLSLGCWECFLFLFFLVLDTGTVLYKS